MTLIKNYIFVLGAGLHGNQNVKQKEKYLVKKKKQCLCQPLPTSQDIDTRDPNSESIKYLYFTDPPAPCLIHIDGGTPFSFVKSTEIYA